MKLVVDPIVVNSGDGFRSDLLGRQPFAEVLTNLVTNVDNEVVLSINARWGEGKTTFVRMWRDLLRSRRVPSIYVDAYRSELVGDPFLTVASEISELVKNECEGTVAFRDFIGKAKAVGVSFLSWSGKVALKALTLGAVGSSEIDQLQDVKETIATEASKEFGHLVAKELADQSSRLAILDEFKKLLSEIPEKIPGNESKRIVVIVDELDRCSPKYSVEFLEKMKHVFSVKNVVFVLVLHKAQLEASVNAVYGLGIDAHTYLQKFINLEAQLPAPTRKTGKGLYRFIQSLHAAHGLNGIQRSADLLNCSVVHADYFALTLRDVERVYTNITMFYATKQGNLVIEPLLVFLCCLKIARPKAFAMLAAGDATYSGLLKELRIDPSVLNMDQRMVYSALGWVQYSLMSEEEFNRLPQDHELRRYAQSLWNFNIEAKRIIPWHLEVLTTFNTGRES